MNKKISKTNSINSFGLKSKFLHGSNWIITIVAVVAVAVLFNVIVGAMTDKFQFKLDLTNNRILQISDTTKKIISELEKDVNIIIIEDGISDFPYINEIIEKYEASSSKIHVKEVNVVSNPSIIQKYDIVANDIMSNSIIVECGDKYKHIMPFDIFPQDATTELGSVINAEGVLTSAIVYVTSDENTKIGVIEGHGEVDFLNSSMGNALKKQFIDYEYINLFTQAIPDDVKYLIIAGPERDFTPDEIDKLDAYLASGRSVQIMFSVTAPYLNNLEGYLREWGLKLNSDTIIDNNPQFQYNGDENLVWVEGGKHYITSSLDSMIIPHAKSLDVDREVNLNDLEISPVFTTSPQATSTDNTDGKTTDGQFILSMFVKDTTSGSSILAVGSSTIYADKFSEDNYDFFTKAMSYQMDSDLITLIKPKSLAPASLSMSASDVQFVTIVVVFLIPFSILIWGFIVWLRRRHL